VRLHQAKRRVGAAALRLVILLPAAASVADCSLVDGWGGLEGGGNGSHDAAMSPSDGGDAATMAVGPACGNVRCDSTKGCCANRQGGGGTCELATACIGQTNVFVACDDSSECVSGETCCFGYAANAVSCVTGMCQGLVVCAESGGTCPAGMHCTGTPATGILPAGYFICM
jgi:hypothetical protein